MSRLIKTLAAAAAYLAAFSCAGAGAQPRPCGKRDDILVHLAGRYAEAPVAFGVADNGSLIEVLTARAGATWTILLTFPSGVSCLIAAGEQWRIQAGSPKQRRPE